MNTDLTIPINNDRITNAIHDLEAQNNPSDNQIKNPLKGILKKPEIISEELTKTELQTAKICSTILFIIIMVPIIVCDLYFGFTDNSCINESPSGLDYTLKMYLLVSGFAGLTVLLVLICVTCSLSSDDDKNITNLLCIKCLGLVSTIFQIIWNILGAVTFWGTVYKTGNCNNMISTYIYVSLIIKFVGNFVGMRENFKNNKK